MREILFRGKRAADEWIEGVAFPHDNHGTVTIFRQNQSDGALEGLEVLPETVGQYSGLTDINGKKVFEGDIIKSATLEPYMTIMKAQVVFSTGKFYGEGYFDVEPFEFKFFEVIGNIYDNPELLEVTV